MAAAATAIRGTTEATQAIPAGRRRPSQTIRPRRGQLTRRAYTHVCPATRREHVRAVPATTAASQAGRMQGALRRTECCRDNPDLAVHAPLRGDALGRV